MVIPYRASELTPAAWTIQEKGIETAPNMKQLAPDIYQRYHAALRAHLGDRRPSGMAAARGLGRELMAAGFDTLALARLHEQALLPLASSHDFARTRNGLNRRAGNFFAAVLSPMEKIHRATRESVLHMKQRAETLRHHTAALTSGKRQLRREVARRKAGEDAVNKGFKDYRRLFMQSQSLETQLRHLARQLLTALEDERRKISRDLHDVVVQTLVGINLQLAELSKSASPRVQTLKMKIARTQRLVEKSVREVHQFAQRPGDLPAQDGAERQRPEQAGGPDADHQEQELQASLGLVHDPDDAQGQQGQGGREQQAEGGRETAKHSCVMTDGEWARSS